MEDELPLGRHCPVKSENAGECDTIRGEGVDAWFESEASEVGGEESSGWACCERRVVGIEAGGFGCATCSSSSGGGDGADSWREAGDGGSWASSAAASNDCCAGAGQCRGSDGAVWCGEAHHNGSESTLDDGVGKH